MDAKIFCSKIKGRLPFNAESSWRPINPTFNSCYSRQIINDSYNFFYQSVTNTLPHEMDRVQ